ncbi:MAG: hypothetical protein GY771_11385 [bacterium]|nr:hypothetical protein [bacterium]
MSVITLGGCTGEFPIGDGDDRAAGPAYYPDGNGSHWDYSYRRYLNNVPYGEVVYTSERFSGEREINGITVQELLIGDTQDFVIGASRAFILDNDNSRAELYGYQVYDSGTSDVVTEVFPNPWNYLSYPLQVGDSWQGGFGTDLSPIVLGLPDDIDDDGQPDAVDVEIHYNVTEKEDITTVTGYFSGCYKIKKTIYVEYDLTAGVNEAMDFTQFWWYCPEVGFVRSIGDEIGYPNGPRFNYSQELSDYEIVVVE